MEHRRWTAVALALAVLISATVMAVNVTPASAATTALRAVGANRCLDVPGASQTNGTQVHIWDCNGGANQTWTTTSAGQLQVYGNKCLDASGGGTAPGTAAVIWDCNGSANQQWNLNGNGTITGVQSGLCLDVSGGGTANGSQVILWTCGGQSNQQWAQGGTTPPPGQLCNPYDSITMGKYWINNNVWGSGSGSGTQCIWSNSTPGDTISWGTSFNWTGQSNSVKSYAASVLGWHWGWKNTNTGLPVQLSANRNINTNWNYQVTHNNSVTMNVAYDMWFHTIANPTYADQPTDELMIWPYRSGGAGPAGSLQGTVNIGGTTWQLYRGVVGSWNVFSYVRVSNTNSVSLNVRDFTNDLVSRGWMSSSKYLTSVQAGTEVFIGNGWLDTTSYSVSVQ
jgi:xyloglucan-specific endo-beta-1,4-glucanase